eukprot:jgi/Psemu1/52083/gm1.52083_g
MEFNATTRCSKKRKLTTEPHTSSTDSGKNSRSENCRSNTTTTTTTTTTATTTNSISRRRGWLMELLSFLSSVVMYSIIRSVNNELSAKVYYESYVENLQFVGAASGSAPWLRKNNNGTTTSVNTSASASTSAERSHRLDSIAEPAPDAGTITITTDVLPPEPFDRSLRTSPRVPSQSSREYFDRMRLKSVRRWKRRRKSQQRVMFYTACCGLGHRLVKQAGSVRVIKREGYDHLWVFWTQKRGSTCGSRRAKGNLDMFEHLFGPGPVLFLDDGQADRDPDLKNYNDHDAAVALALAVNEPGSIVDAALEAELTTIQVNTFMDEYHKNHSNRLRFKKHLNGDPNQRPRCIQKKTRREIQWHAVTDERFYRQLRSTFRFNDRIRSFVARHRFAERIVVGVHVRTGNGETGDFEKKRRGIAKQEVFYKNMVNALHQLVGKMQAARLPSASETGREATPPGPLVFVATDDPEVVDVLSELLGKFGVEAVSFPQVHMEGGKGVTYRNNDFESDEQCQENWISQVIDSMILGMSDALVTARYSSFTQSQPLMALFSDSIRAQHKNGWRGNPDERRVKHAANFEYSYDGPDMSGSRFANRLFCNSDEEGHGMKCFDDYVDWLQDRNIIYVGQRYRLHSGRFKFEIVADCSSSPERRQDGKEIASRNHTTVVETSNNRDPSESAFFLRPEIW